jgi:hypothetical protein
MWTIRQEQTEAFRQHHLQKFEDEMVEHLKKFSPHQCKMAGEPAVRQGIRLGIENAGKYGFTNRGPARFYLELAFMFGSYFDTDPQYPWARAVLTSAEKLDQAGRADRLYYQLSHYLEEVAGLDQKLRVDAHQRASQLRLKDIVRGQARDESVGLLVLSAVYPQKCDYLGAASLLRLIARSLEIADRVSLNNEEGRVLIALTAFFCGHQFLADPLFPWISASLREAGSPQVRQDRLFKKMVSFLTQAADGERGD